MESTGWTLAQVARHAPQVLGPSYADHEPWFGFSAPCCQDKVWFDATVQRTERYGLWAVPFLRERLLSVHVFHSLAAISTAVSPFVAEQARRHEQHPDGEGAAAKAAQRAL